MILRFEKCFIIAFLPIGIWSSKRYAVMRVCCSKRKYDHYHLIILQNNSISAPLNLIVMQRALLFVFFKYSSGGSSSLESVISVVYLHSAGVKKGSKRLLQRRSEFRAKAALQTRLGMPLAVFWHLHNGPCFLSELCSNKNLQCGAYLPFLLGEAVTMVVSRFSLIGLPNLHHNGNVFAHSPRTKKSSFHY